MTGDMTNAPMLLRTLTVKSKGTTYAVTVTGDVDGLDVTIARARDGAVLATGMFDAGGLILTESEAVNVPGPAFEKIHDAIEDYIADVCLEAEG